MQSKEAGAIIRVHDIRVPPILRNRPVRVSVHCSAHPRSCDSVASIMKGTEITLELSLETTRSASGSMTNALTQK